ncbi:hypothetical protein CAMRE0001_1130 [Campylobacter rectus RM3267]|uniref:Uncharacterized protein n=1 Tax=Campylobacter rectus RM3267 TaxID=553218 RepID=B9D0D0_CAMRE|nr:hypothetical protein CAMRE0001_1130 [Campylobacter rectus RM3267]
MSHSICGAFISASASKTSAAISVNIVFIKFALFEIYFLFLRKASVNLSGFVKFASQIAYERRAKFDADFK